MYTYTHTHTHTYDINLHTFCLEAINYAIKLALAYLPFCQLNRLLYYFNSKIQR